MGEKRNESAFDDKRGERETINEEELKGIEEY